MKKVCCALLTFIMLFSFSFSSLVNAATLDTISEDTIITEENAAEVAEYLGIKDKIVPNSLNSDYTTYTVGELCTALDTLSKNSKDVILYNNTNEYPEISTRASGVKSLYFNGNASDNYDFTVIVGGKYSGTKWTGVGTIEASIDSNAIATVYKIKSNQLTASWTSTKITLGGYVNVGVYLGVGGLGLIETNSFKIEPYAVWTASAYL